MRRKKTVNSSTNVKVRNATPNIVNGIEFKSKLESYTYLELQKYGITAEYEPISFNILDAFKYDGENVRKMSYTPDFVGDDFIIECKGFANDAFPLRWKVFKYFLYMNKLTYKLFKVTKKSEVDEMIQVLIERKKDGKETKETSKVEKHARKD